MPPGVESDLDAIEVRAAAVCVNRNNAVQARNLFDRDTAPGAEPEDLLRLDIPALIVPGRDAAHATSAARYLEECLPRAPYWDIPVAEQTEANVPPQVLAFLDEATQ